jgi:hypothetical protein
MIIGPSTYSKDPNLIPDGIALTLPEAFFEDRRTTPAKFKPMFERYMRREDAIWNFKITNLPTLEFQWVYLIFDRQFQYRCNFVMTERNKSKTFYDAPDRKKRHFPPANWILMTGPAVKPPSGEEWPQKGFRGFRYTIKLF